MRRIRRPSARRVAPRRRVGGSHGLVVGLHGYGSDERQLDTLLPLDLPVITVQPRAPHPVDPGFGWWLPVVSEQGDAVELAPGAGVDAAVDEVVATLVSSQEAEGVGPDSTVLLGYSQGATLALSLAARRPDLMAAVAVGAGLLLPVERVVAGRRPLSVSISNGTLDPFVGLPEHASSLERFAAAGHRVSGRRDPIPHVIDRAQVAGFEAFVADVLGIAVPER